MQNLTSFSQTSAGNITLKSGKTLSMSGAFLPSTSDAAALGSATLMWSDLFLASGGVVNFNNGDVTLTHSSNTITVAGGLNVVASGGSIINGIVVTNATLGVTDSRAIKVSTSQAAPNMADGYGVVEIDHTITGTAGASTFPVAALSSWVNIPSGTVGAGKYICAQNNGVYELTAATITNAKIIFGMRAQKLLEDTDALSFPFSLNTNNTAITALFDVNNATDMGWLDGVLSGSTGDGHIPLFRDAAGVVHYVNTYVE